MQVTDSILRINRVSVAPSFKYNVNLTEDVSYSLVIF